MDYLAAAVGGDRGRAVAEKAVGNPPCIGSTGGNGVCMPGPSSDWCACPLPYTWLLLWVGQGAVGERVVGNSHCAGTTGGNGP